MAGQSFTKSGALSGILGAIILFVSTLLHPMEADPNDPAAAFAEYAADQYWVSSHLGQFAGVLLIVAGLVGLHQSINDDHGRLYAQLGMAAAIATTQISLCPRRYSLC